MKNTIQAIYNASGKEYPSDDATLYAIDFLSELIDENHSLEDPEEFLVAKCYACDFEDYSPFLEKYEEYQEALQEYQEENESVYSELFDAIEELADKLDFEDDFYFEYDGNEYRIIKDSEIWDIFVEEIKNLVEDYYSDVLKLDDIPGFIEFSIDWEQTAKNIYVDGYGPTFSSYDHSELEIKDFFVFRTN